MSSIIKFSLTILVSMVAGAVAMHLWNSEFKSTDNNLAADSNEPLYWVAPMDPNYRRDKPGKSPMGMDLVPVFAEDNSSAGDANGVVEIAPHVVNNLGVRTAEAEVRNLSTTISTVGYVQYDENKLIHIHPRVAGWIEDLYVRAEGDPVRKGQALYTLYSPELVNAQEEILIAQRLQDKALLNSSKQRLLALQISDDFISKLLKSGQVKQAVPFYATQDGIVDELEVRDGFY
ncbi:MAG: biotin/lipoyl-binding protein, partial [Enterobacterales bacterium]|nr:biotin/lipoyl-binding protein [Enterobacterales bacterium]